MQVCLNENGERYLETDLAADKNTGLTSEERDIVAEAYDQGAIKVVVGNIYLIEPCQLILTILFISNSNNGCRHQFAC